MYLTVFSLVIFISLLCNVLKIINNVYTEMLRAPIFLCIKVRRLQALFFTVKKESLLLVIK